MTQYMDIEVKGLNELNNKLRIFGSLIQKKAAVDMTKATASSLARVMRKNCPVGTQTYVMKNGKTHVPGTLKKSIRISQIKTNNYRKIQYIVGFTFGKRAKYDGGRYAHIVEFGAAPHLIPRKGEVKLMRVGSNYFTGPIQHPGHVGSRFVTRSFEEGYTKAIATGQKSFERSLKKNMK